MQSKITFFKNRIKNRLEELKPFMSDVKYRLYISMIEDCDNFEEIREMAELDLQFNMIKYVRDLDTKLKLSDTNIEELEAVTNKNNRAIKLTVIAPKKNKTNKEIADDIDFSDIGEDIEDEDLLASAANILFMRLQNTPPEELYSSDEDEYFNEDDVDAIDLEEDFYDEEADDFEEDEEVEEIEGFELDLDEHDLELESNALDYEEENAFENIDEIFEEEDDDEIIDFGMDSEDNSESFDIDNISDNDLFVDEEEADEDEEDNLDSLCDNIFGDEDDYEEESDDEEEDLDSLCDNIFDDNEDYEEESDDEYDIDNIDEIDDSLFEDYNEEEYENNSEDDIDSLDIDSIFEDSDEDDFFEEDNSLEDEIDSFSEDSIDSLFGDDDYVEEDIEDEDNSMDIDSIDTDSLFGDEEDKDFEPEFDIDEDQFEFEEPDEDSFDDFFDRNTPNNNASKPVEQPVVREKTSQKVFINGTKRGNQTQQMFNMLGSIFGGTSNLAKKAAKGTKNITSKGINKINSSDFFKL